MPPKPIEDIDFPDLGGKILELLYAVWIFICDIFVMLWSYVSQACWAVWTWPPFETFRNEFTAALVALWDYVVAHPVASTAICILAFVFIPTALNMISVCLLQSLDCRERGPLRNTHTVYYQSTGYGRHRDLGSSRSQSQKAKPGRGQYRTVGASGSPSWT